MCLIITFLAAIISTIFWYLLPARNVLRLGTLSLMYWGASLMWTIDGFFCLAEGEPFFDLSIDDALLGVLILVAGLSAWLIILLVKDPKGILRQQMQKN